MLRKVSGNTSIPDWHSPLLLWLVLMPCWILKVVYWHVSIFARDMGMWSAWSRNLRKEQICREVMKAIGGMYVLNSGTLIGPSKMMVRYFDLMTQEFQLRWHCMRLHGSDQAVHNYLTYTGKLISTGRSFNLHLSFRASWPR